MDDHGGSGQVVQPAVIPGRSMAVLYGSETGNAEDIAGELARTAERLHFQTTVDEMDGFKLADVLRSSLVIFVTSTTGQGDMPKNTLKFWKNLRREKLNNTNCLGSLRFAIFGLGDSSYPKFNWSARKLRARLLQLGATEFFRPGEGDERHDNGIDSIYFPWYEELKTSLLADYPLPESLSPIPDDAQLPPKYPLELLPVMEPSRTHHGGAGMATGTENAARSHTVHPQSAAVQQEEHWKRLEVTFPADMARRDDVFERENPREFTKLDKDNILRDHPDKYLLEQPPACASEPPPADLLPIPDTSVARLVRHVRMTPADHWQDVRHLTFDLQLEDKIYDNLADYSGHLTLVLWPKNYQEDVEEMISLMGWEALADRSLKLHRAPRGLYSKRVGVTLRELLTHNLDITAVPKRSFIRDMVHFTQNENEKERLEEFLAPGNEQEFYDYTCRPRRTIIEVLRDFPGVKIPFSRIIDLFPFIRGREFSVCNGGPSLNLVSKINTIRLQILVALVEYKTIIRKPRQGLCSRYLKHLPVGTRLAVRVNPSSGPSLVPNPAGAKRPLIAIATGTGIAPIRAILQERHKYDHPGDTLLFFGSRNRDADFYFEDEWPAFPSVCVFPAFSRDRIEPNPEYTATGAPPADGLAAAAAALDPSVPQYDAHKNYVQHLIRRYADQVGNLMRRKPIVCICGNAGRMPISVRSALLDALVASGVVENMEEAERWLGNPENVTLWQETW